MWLRKFVMSVCLSLSRISMSVSIYIAHHHDNWKKNWHPLHVHCIAGSAVRAEKEPASADIQTAKPTHVGVRSRLGQQANANKSGNVVNLLLAGLDVLYLCMYAAVLLWCIHWCSGRAPQCQKHSTNPLQPWASCWLTYVLRPTQLSPLSGMG